MVCKAEKPEKIKFVDEEQDDEVVEVSKDGKATKSTGEMEVRYFAPLCFTHHLKLLC